MPVRGRLPLVVDDMLSTGGTLEAAIGALRAAGAVDPIAVAVTHALLVNRAREIPRKLPLIAADTVTIEPPPVAHLEVTSVASLIATAIRRNHRDESLADVRVRA